MSPAKSKETITPSQQAQELLAQIRRGISKVKNSQAWRDWVEVQSRFPFYSPFNTWLVHMARPNATKIAGFRRWKEWGRWVRKGEKGIRILAPLLVKIPNNDKEDSEGEKIQVLKGFKAVSVFDISQTDGKALPQVYGPLQGEAPEGLFERLKTFAESKGFTVQFGPMPSPDTYGYINSSHEIYLKENQSQVQNIGVLAHELCHGLLGHPSESHQKRDVKELEAETSAYILLRNLGLETDSNAFVYLTSWTHNDKSGEKLASAAQTAVGLAQKILKALDVPELKHAT